MGVQKAHFWFRKDKKLGEALLLGLLTLEVLMEDMKWWVRLGLVLLVAQKAPPLLFFGKGEPTVEEGTGVVAV